MNVTNPGRDGHRLQNLAIASRLLDDFVAAGSAPGRLHVDRPPFALEYDEWGRPRLRREGFADLAVSFSRVTDTLWAALAGPHVHLGLDAARAEEFDGDYPFHRTFHPEELRLPVSGAHGLRECAALLWSVKEAAVKALGVGFGLLGPLDIAIESMKDHTTHIVPRVVVACGRSKLTGPNPFEGLKVTTFRHAGTWVSVAIRRDELRGGRQWPQFSRIA